MIDAQLSVPLVERFWAVVCPATLNCPLKIAFPWQVNAAVVVFANAIGLPQTLKVELSCKLCRDPLPNAVIGPKDPTPHTTNERVSTGPKNTTGPQNVCAPEGVVCVRLPLTTSPDVLIDPITRMSLVVVVPQLSVPLVERFWAVTCPATFNCPLSVTFPWEVSAPVVVLANAIGLPQTLKSELSCVLCRTPLPAAVIAAKEPVPQMLVVCWKVELPVNKFNPFLKITGPPETIKLFAPNFPTTSP